MENRDFEHGFRKEVNKYDRVRGIQGTRRGEYYGKGPKNWKKSDEKIREEVCEALYFNPHIDASDIDVTVQEGSVSLKGWVEDRESKREAELCADQVAGVVDVDNEIHLRNRKT